MVWSNYFTKYITDYFGTNAQKLYNTRAHVNMCVGKRMTDSFTSIEPFQRRSGHSLCRSTGDTKVETKMILSQVNALIFSACNKRWETWVFFFFTLFDIPNRPPMYAKLLTLEGTLYVGTASCFAWHFYEDEMLVSSTINSRFRT